MHLQEYPLDVSTIIGAMLLNALKPSRKPRIPTLGFRRSCGEGVCGSDGMNINGKNGLACKTKLHDLPDRVVLQPLTGFPVIRDLIVDMKQFFDQYEKVKPYSAKQKSAAGHRAFTVSRRARQTGWFIRMYFMRLLHQLLPFLLVESG